MSYPSESNGTLTFSCRCSSCRTIAAWPPLSQGSLEKQKLPGLVRCFSLPATWAASRWRTWKKPGTRELDKALDMRSPHLVIAANVSIGENRRIDQPTQALPWAVIFCNSMYNQRLFRYFHTANKTPKWHPFITVLLYHAFLSGGHCEKPQQPKHV